MNTNARVQVSKRFTMELAHALSGHDGPCRHIHGHSYVLDVTISGVPRVAPVDPKDGMVMDFTDLKAIANRCVVDHYDHALVLHDSEREAFPAGHPLFARTRLTPWQPTCENLLLDMVERLQAGLPPGIELHSARLQETATTWAEWSR